MDKADHCHQGSAEAAASHTGSLAGSDALLDAAFTRWGTRLPNFSTWQKFCPKKCDLLSRRCHLIKLGLHPAGPRLTIITNVGGATEALGTSGGQLSLLSEETTTALNAILPPQGSQGKTFWEMPPSQILMPKRWRFVGMMSIARDCWSC